MEILNKNIINSTILNSFEVISNIDGVRIIFTGEKMIDDNISYVNPYCKEILKPENNFSSILMIGLGLGVISQYISENMLECTTIDVIDNNQELIDWAMASNYLNSNINILSGDCYTYTPTKTYDLILVDIWWDSSIALSKKDEIIARYNQYLTSNGNIYFPLIEQIIKKQL